LNISIREENTSVDGSLSVNWTLSAGTAQGLSVICDKGRDDVSWVEGEDFNMGSGWRAEVAFVDGWLGSGYLMDSYNADTARREVILPPAEQAYVWVRFYKRAVDQSPARLQLNQQSLSFADVSEDEINGWLWERIGPFNISGGVNEWRITRPFNEDQSQFMALFIDTLVFTTDSDFSPEENSLWESVKISQYTFSSQMSKGTLEITLPDGNYRCVAEVDSDLPLVDALGAHPVRSNEVTIEIP
jgi:hypothetical protein